MTAEEQQLRELSESLVAASLSGDEPRCIARAFATPAEGELRFTMQHWIDLESIRSPLMRRQEFETVADLKASAGVFDLSIDALNPEEAVRVTEAMRGAIDDAFGLALPMKQPNAPESTGGEGFGAWLPVYTFLVAECRMSRTDALAHPVGEAFALLAATRRNQGWDSQGATYAQRDVIGKEDAHG